MRSLGMACDAQLRTGSGSVRMALQEEPKRLRKALANRFRDMIITSGKWFADARRARPTRACTLMPDDFHTIETRGPKAGLHLHMYGMSLEHLPERITFAAETGGKYWVYPPNPGIATPVVSLPVPAVVGIAISGFSGPGTGLPRPIGALT